MSQDPVTQTVLTYDQIAVDYAQQWQDRGTLSTHVARFLELLPTDSVVCDVGCGPGFDMAVLNKHGYKVIGLDRSWGMMQAGQRDYDIDQTFVQVDMRDLPFGKTAVDGLWVCASLLHLSREDVPHTLQAFAHILKPAGLLYLSVKMGDADKWMRNPYKDDLPRFFTYWQAETLDLLLRQAGFTIIDGWEKQGSRDRWLVRFAQRNL